MSELVQTLSSTTHRVELVLRPEPTMDALRACLQRGYIHVRFPDTRGGTELGITLDRHATDASHIESGDLSGSLTVVGRVTLDYVKVRCIATVDISSLRGEGRLEVVSD